MLDLGAGEGRFAARLHQLGLTTIQVDRTFSTDDDQPRVCADLLSLPFGAESVGGIVLANVARHFPSATRSSLANECARTLRPGGTVLLLEDVGEARDPAETNYRDTLRWLAEYDPTRGGVLDAAEARLSFSAALGPPVDEGITENAEEVLAPERPLDWLRSRMEHPPQAFQQLARSVQRHGMTYGPYWFQIYLRHG